MRVGSADPERLAEGAPVLPDLATEPVALAGVEILQVTFEIRAADLDAHLPPALHPTLPPLVTWVVYRVPDSPWGPFQLAQTRLECRSGTRPRGFLVGGASDNDAAARALGERWGYRLQSARVELVRHYDEVHASVWKSERCLLDVGLRDPEPLRPGDVQYVANMNLAHTPRGLRLIQVDPDVNIERAERGQPRLTRFDAEAWGNAALEPSHPVSASLVTAELVLPRLRYVCLPDVLAFTGTEPADA